MEWIEYLLRGVLQLQLFRYKHLFVSIEHWPRIYIFEWLSKLNILVHQLRKK